jgi:hypothetical protein
VPWGSAGVSDYTYDVFLSYRRAGTVPEWVHNHFRPMLVKHLTDEFDHRKPEVFIDVEGIQTGDRWPERLRHAHARSRVLVAVWTPSYFGSRWCQAEWQTMVARERLLGLAGSGKPQGLIYPVVLKDGDRFPQEAQLTQSRDMKDWNVSTPAFKKSPRYPDFENQVAQVAGEIFAMLTASPPWQSDWPVVDAPLGVLPDDPPDVPRL